MSVEQIKKELAGLSAKEKTEVAAFLFHLRHAEDTDYQAAIQQRMNDKNPEHWLSPDEFEKRLNRD